MTKRNRAAFLNIALLAASNTSPDAVLDEIALKRIRRSCVQPLMPEWAAEDRVEFSVAEDVGGIELIYASFRNYSIPPHMHDDFSISVSLRGGLAFDHRGSRHVAPSGVISAVEPGEVHNAGAGGGHGWAFVNLLVPVAAVKTIATEISGQEDSPGFLQRVIHDPPLAARLVALHAQLETSRNSLERDSAAVFTLSHFFGRHSTARRELHRLGREQHAVRKARQLLEDSFAERISLRQLAAWAGLSPFYFLRIFRAEVGLTPHAYLNQVRIGNAKRKLAAGASPAQVALDCGFCDQSHLVRHFKAATGTTPGQYQGAYAGRAWHGQGQ